MPRSVDRRYSCPVELTLDVVGGKWKPMILWLLRGQKRRFNDLQAAMPGITHKVLTHQLRELERDGIVTRTVTSEPPPAGGLRSHRLRRDAKAHPRCNGELGETSPAAVWRDDFAAPCRFEDRPHEREVTVNGGPRSRGGRFSASLSLRRFSGAMHTDYSERVLQSTS